MNKRPMIRKPVKSTPKKTNNKVIQKEETPKYDPHVDRFQNVPAYVFGADTKEKDENIY